MSEISQKPFRKPHSPISIANPNGFRAKADQFGRDVDVYTMFKGELENAVAMLSQNEDLIPANLKPSFEALLSDIKADETLDPEAQALRLKDKIAVFIMENWKALNQPVKYESDVYETMAILRTGLGLIPGPSEDFLKKNRFSNAVKAGIENIFSGAAAHIKAELPKLGIQIKEGTTENEILIPNSRSGEAAFLTSTNIIGQTTGLAGHLEFPNRNEPKEHEAIGAALVEDGCVRAKIVLSTMFSRRDQKNPNPQSPSQNFSID